MFAALTRPFLYSPERSITCVPGTVLFCLIAGLVLQIWLYSATVSETASYRQLPPAPPVAQVKLASLSDPVALARMIMLWLQSHDTQPGISVSFKQLDYDRLVQWLGLVLALDPAGQYPLLAAARIYAEVNNESRQRKMLAFVRAGFLEDPDRRWPAMAHAVYVAKHKLNDLELALSFARDLAKHVNAESVPPWIRQMHIYVLEDMGELESAMVLIGGLLESGQIRDEQEMRFLQQRLEKLREELDES